MDYNAAPEAETMARQGETRSSIRQIVARRDRIKNEQFPAEAFPQAS